MVNVVVGTPSGDPMVGSADQDLLIGGAGDDIIAGGAGDDVLIASNLNLPELGAAGFDTNANLNLMAGGAGKDLLIAGDGHDGFLFETGSGIDLIEGFNPSADLLILQSNINGTGLASTAGLSLIDTQFGVIVDLGANNGVLLDGIDSSQLTTADFLIFNMPSSANAAFDVEPAAAADSTGSQAAFDVEPTTPQVSFDNTGSTGTNIQSGPSSASALPQDLAGTPGDDQLQGGPGGDTLWGNAGNDSIVGGAGDDRLLGDLGNDLLDGGPGADAIFAGAGDDLLIGGADADVLIGGFGKDRLAGQGGNDLLFGGDGQDTFFLEANTGHDVIADFQPGVDKMGLVPFSGADAQFKSVADVLSHIHAGIDGSAVIDLFNGSSVTVLGVAPSALTASDFFVAA